MVLENCLQRFCYISLCKWLGRQQVIQKPFQWNWSLAISAVLYHRWGHLDLAKKHYEISLRLDPTASGTKENYGLLRRKLEQMQKKNVWSLFLHVLSLCVCVHEADCPYLVLAFNHVKSYMLFTSLFFFLWKQRPAKRL